MVAWGLCSGYSTESVREVFKGLENGKRIVLGMSEKALLATYVFQRALKIKKAIKEVQKAIELHAL